MIISEVVVNNFRLFRGEKAFNFYDQPFIMIAAPNGLGKTTLIDAIEWCLTGTIRRLQRSFDARSSTKQEKEINSRGILKNKYCSDNDIVEVKLTLIDEEGNSFNICRKRIEDELFEPDSERDNSELIIDQGLLDWFNELDKRDFYNSHICDVQKVFRIQSEKRDKNIDLLKEFISDYSQEELLLENLDWISNGYKEKLSLITKEIEACKTNIKKLNDEKGKITLEEKALSYPQEKLYPEEYTDFSGIDFSLIQQQKSRVDQYVFAFAALIQDATIKTKCIPQIIDKLQELLTIVNEDGKLINKAINYGINNREGKYQKIIEKIHVYQNLVVDKTTVFDIAKQICMSEKIDYSKFGSILDEIQTINKSINNKMQERQQLSTGNSIIDAFSSLLERKPVWIEYKERSKESNPKCPVCGSYQFSEIDSSDLLKEAETYLFECNKRIAAISEEVGKLTSNLESLYKHAINETEIIKLKVIVYYQNELSVYEELKEQTKAFFDCVDYINELYDFSNRNIKFNNPNDLNEIIAKLKNELEASKIILNTNISIDPLLKKVRFEHATESDEIKLMYYRAYSGNINELNPNISYDILLNKVIYLDNYLNNRRINNIQENISLYKQKIARKTAEQKEIKHLRTSISNQKRKISNKVKELQTAEYASVWPKLENIYNKLARNRGVDSINIRREGTLKAWSFEDEAEKQIVNILSNGQMSVFLLSFFFASMISREDEDKFKVYFLDDLSACLDDINMLAFIDLLKYQIKNGHSIDQLVFSTCDERIRKLIEYKFGGAKIGYRPITENDFVL